MAEYDADLGGIVLAHCPTHGNYIYRRLFIHLLTDAHCPKCPPWIPPPEVIEGFRNGRPVFIIG